MPRRDDNDWGSILRLSSLNVRDIMVSNGRPRRLVTAEHLVALCPCLMRLSASFLPSWRLIPGSESQECLYGQSSWTACPEELQAAHRTWFPGVFAWPKHRIGTESQTLEFCKIGLVAIRLVEMCAVGQGCGRVGFQAYLRNLFFGLQSCSI